MGLRDHEPERGQLLVIFALALVALIGVVGLIIDGGDTALQRRDQQNVADAAAMAAGYAHVNGQDEAVAARTVASANGYTDDVGGTVITVTVGSAAITVDVTRPHRNYFSGLLGFATWNVATTATVRAGVPNAASGTIPVIFNEDILSDLDTYFDAESPVSFGEPPPGTEDVPAEADEFNWTVFCVASSETCNANSDVVEDWIDEEGIDATVALDWEIAPLNAGSHTTLFDSMSTIVGGTYPVAIVNDAGVLTGWACFTITGSVGGETKSISGYFELECDMPELGWGDGDTISGLGSAGIFGGWQVELID
jgi:Flp pilus assembly protein TadG